MIQKKDEQQTEKTLIKNWACLFVPSMDNGYVMKAKNQRSGQKSAFWAGLKPASAES